MRTQLLSLVLLPALFAGAAQEKPEFIDMGTSVLWGQTPIGVTETSPYGGHYYFGAPDVYPQASYFNIWGWNDAPAQWGNDPRLDAVTAAFGKGYCTPSKAEMLELLRNCEYDYSLDYSINRYVLTLKSKTTGNTLRIVGGGYWSFGNDHTDARDLYLITSTCDTENHVGCYLNPDALIRKGVENSVMNERNPVSVAYQILPVYSAEKVVKAQSVSLNESTQSISVSGKVTLIATVLPDDTTDPSLVWTSSDESVATVDANGEVEGIGAGECTVTATTTDGSNVTASCVIKVIDSSSTMKFVDMGLSVMWGDCEIGASDYTQKGTYYTWGTVDHAGDYTYADAEHYATVPDGNPCTGVARDEANPTKPYDIATEVLGSKWHTPTLAQWDELVENSTVDKVKIDDVYYARFTSKINGNQLFMLGYGYLRSSSASPSMSNSVILQASDSPDADLIYNTINVVNPAVNRLPRYAFWMVPVRPVYNENTMSIEGVESDSADTLFDVYDITGRFIARGVTFDEVRSRLSRGFYLLVGSNGKTRKVAF